MYNIFKVWFKNRRAKTRQILRNQEVLQNSLVLNTNAELNTIPSTSNIQYIGKNNLNNEFSSSINENNTVLSKLSLKKDSSETNSDIKNSSIKSFDTKDVDPNKKINKNILIKNEIKTEINKDQFNSYYNNDKSNILINESHLINNNFASDIITGKNQFNMFQFSAPSTSVEVPSWFNATSNAGK